MMWWKRLLWTIVIYEKRALNHTRWIETAQVSDGVYTVGDLKTYQLYSLSGTISNYANVVRSLYACYMCKTM